MSVSSKIYNDYEYDIILQNYQKNKNRFSEKNTQYIELKEHIQILLNGNKQFNHCSQNRTLHTQTYNKHYKHKTSNKYSTNYKNKNSRFSKNEGRSQLNNSFNNYSSRKNESNKFSSVFKSSLNSQPLNSIEQYKKTLRSHLNKYTTTNKEKISKKIKDEFKDIICIENSECIVNIFLDTYFEMITKEQDYIQLYLNLFETVFVNNTLWNNYRKQFINYIETKNHTYISTIKDIQPVDTTNYDTFCLYNKDSEKRIQYFTLSILIYSNFIWTPDTEFTINHAIDALYGIWKTQIFYEEYITSCTEIIKIIVNILKNKSMMNIDFLKSLKYIINDIHKTVKQKDKCLGLSNKSYFEILNLNKD